MLRVLEIIGVLSFESQSQRFDPAKKAESGAGNCYADDQPSRRGKGRSGSGPKIPEGPSLKNSAGHPEGRTASALSFSRGRSWARQGHTRPFLPRTLAATLARSSCGITGQKLQVRIDGQEPGGGDCISAAHIDHFPLRALTKSARRGNMGSRRILNRAKRRGWASRCLYRRRASPRCCLDPAGTEGDRAGRRVEEEAEERGDDSERSCRGIKNPQECAYPGIPQHRRARKTAKRQSRSGW